MPDSRGYQYLHKGIPYSNRSTTATIPDNRKSRPKFHLGTIAPFVGEELVGANELDTPETEGVVLPDEDGVALALTLATVVAVAVARKLSQAAIVALGTADVPAVVPDP